MNCNNSWARREQQLSVVTPGLPSKEVRVVVFLSASMLPQWHGVALSTLPSQCAHQLLVRDTATPLDSPTCIMQGASWAAPPLNSSHALGSLTPAKFCTGSNGPGPQARHVKGSCGAPPPIHMRLTQPQCCHCVAGRLPPRATAGCREVPDCIEGVDAQEQ